MNASAASRRLRALAAAWLLLLQGMLPVLHQLQHALADGAAPQAATLHEKSSAPAASAGAEEHADACSICVQLMQVRDLLPELPAVTLAGAAPPRALTLDVGPCWFVPAPALPPPCRGPPVS